MLNKLKSKFLSRLSRKSAKKKIRNTFIKSNKKYWRNARDKRHSKNGYKVVLVEVSEKNPFELESNMRVAKAIEHIQGCNIVALLKASSKRDAYYHLIKSYLIHKVILSSSYINNTRNFICSLIDSYKIILNIKSPEDIERVEYKGILIGDLIYDTYIRMMPGKYRPERNFNLFKYILFAIMNYKQVSKVFDAHDVEYLVVADKCYLNHGILYRVAVQRGIHTLLPVKELKLINKNNIYSHIYHPEISLEEMSNELDKVDLDYEVETYFKARFSGDIEQVDVLSSYKNKIMYSKKSLEELLSLNPKKKNVIIMPHAFSDFPHIAKGLYSDYYVWLVTLLKIIRSVDNVNWLIKPHPTSYMFNENGVVENLLDELEVNNVKLIPSDMNTASVKDFADVVLTVRGTAGLEFATFGIPVVTAGEGCYSGYGIDISPLSVSDYERKIRSLDNIPRLDDSIISTAKMVFYYLFIKKNARLTYLMHDIADNLGDFDMIFGNITDIHELELFTDNVLHIETCRILEHLSK